MTRLIFFLSLCSFFSSERNRRAVDQREGITSRIYERIVGRPREKETEKTCFSSLCVASVEYLEQLLSSLMRIELRNLASLSGVELRKHRFAITFYRADINSILCRYRDEMSEQYAFFLSTIHRALFSNRDKKYVKKIAIISRLREEIVFS